MLSPTTLRSAMPVAYGLRGVGPILARHLFTPVLSPFRLGLQLETRRPMSAASSPLRRFINSPAIQPQRLIGNSPAIQLQRRTFGTNGISRSLLASREANANRHPNSASAQTAFYELLLKANMPAIVIERYQSGLYSSDTMADHAYQRALNMVNPAIVVGNQGLTEGISHGNLSPSQAQAIAQGIAAKSRGATTAVSTDQGAGNKQAPLYVVVDESRGAVAFRWLKFGLWFFLALYLSLVVVTILVGFFDGMNVMKRPSEKATNEVKAEAQKTRFADVHGCDEAKDELQELVDFLRNPDKFSTLGGKLPKGVLLVGPPGTGKTLLARAVAGEAGVPFFYMSGSEFDEVYVGVGAKRVRDLFNAAKSKSPAIVFIDELDAIGSRRNARDASYVKQTLNQLLTELDGFEQNSGVIILAATNFPELLDKALTRPGRFDRHVVVPLPDVRGRLAILQHHLKKITASSEVKLEPIAAITAGLSGAELENIVNLAAIHASRAKASSVSMKDLDWAKDRVIMGAERKTMVLSPKEKQMTAYHEAGHALVLFYAGELAPNKLYKVTILPRGMSLGHTAFLPQMDKYSQTLSDYTQNIRTCLGGKMAEELVYGSDQITSGVSDDLVKATQIAYTIVSSFGMSQKLGNMDYARNYTSLSSETRAAVESEVQRILAESYDFVRGLLTSKRRELDLLAKALVEYETLDRSEVERVLRGEQLPGRVKAPPGPLTVPIPVSTNPDTDPLSPGPNTESPEPPQPAPPAEAP